MQPRAKIHNELGFRLTYGPIYGRAFRSDLYVLSYDIALDQVYCTLLPPRFEAAFWSFIRAEAFENPLSSKVPGR